MRLNSIKIYLILNKNGVLKLPLAALTTLIQISDSYLRYLAYRNKNSPQENRRYLLRIFIWGMCAAYIYKFIFEEYGVNALTYKAIIQIGWLPYFLILAATFRRKMFQHVFIFGMSMIWVISQNNFAAIIDVIFFKGVPDEEIFLIHSVICLLLFVILLPLERHFFIGLTASEILFKHRLQGYYLAILPLLLGAGHFFLWADTQVYHSWNERFSRLYVILGFFCIYRYVLVGTQNLSEYQRSLNEKKLLEAQRKSLEHHNQLIKNNQVQIENIQENLNKDYENLINLLKKSKVKEVLKYLKRQEFILNSTKIIRFCRAPLINAAISIYMHQAKLYKIPFNAKIKMPPNFSTAESDFAILLSNLLENAINASKKQPENERSISLLIKYNLNQCILEVCNIFTEPIRLNSKGFPVTNNKGHGVGMLSIASFAKKYKAKVAFEQVNDKVRVVMYWEENSK